LDAAPEKERRGSVGYRQIATTLVQEIRSGRWRVDEPMPTEMQLVGRFGVGRNTVREALRELDGLGYIERRRGARSILRSASPEGAFVNSVRSVDELVEYATTTRATLLVSEVVRIDKALADRLDLVADTELMRVGILRRREDGDDPFCYSEVYLDPKYRDVVSMIGTEPQLFPLIEKHHRVVLRRVVQETEAAAADANIASRLNVQVGSPILLVRTKFFSTDGNMVETGLSHFPCGRYRVRIALDRRSVDAS
jgi:GntR family transcriptional regulator